MYKATTAIVIFSICTADLAGQEKNAVGAAVKNLYEIDLKSNYYVFEYAKVQYANDIIELNTSGKIEVAEFDKNYLSDSMQQSYRYTNLISGMDSSYSGANTQVVNFIGKDCYSIKYDIDPKGNKLNSKLAFFKDQDDYNRTHQVFQNAEVEFYASIFAAKWN